MKKEIFKQCSCGRTYTKEEWEQLPNRQLWELSWGEVLELRDCVCRSTMSIQLKAGEPEDEELSAVTLSRKQAMPAWIRR